MKFEQALNPHAMTNSYNLPLRCCSCMEPYDSFIEIKEFEGGIRAGDDLTRVLLSMCACRHLMQKKLNAIALLSLGEAGLFKLLFLNLPEPVEMKRHELLPDHRYQPGAPTFHHSDVQICCKAE